MTNIGKWRLPTEQEARVVLAIFTCPQCGREVSVGRETHVIQGDDLVYPSAICPQDGCSFHEYIRLPGWKAAREKVTP